jgi:predicted esterase
MTRHHRQAQIRDYVAYLDAVAVSLLDEAPGDPALFVLGFSQGQHTAARWTVMGHSRPRGVVFWGDVMPEDLPEQAAERLGETRCVRVRGRGDAHLNAGLLAADDERWREWGVAPDTVEHAEGHEIEAEALTRVVTALERGEPL